MAPIEVKNISKSYGSVEALRDVSFSVRDGELFGLIGPDGAGKSTLFRILTTLVDADCGSACVDGYDVRADYRAVRGCVGYMPGRFSLYQDLSVSENLSFFASLFGTTVEANYDLIAPIYRQIEHFAHRMAGKLSGGMKQKLALCCALIHKPVVLLLDEPTTGVDAVSRSEFWDMLDGLRRQGITIMVSTPYMDEALRCDRIALINQGRILAVDTPAAIASGMTDRLLALHGTPAYRLLTAARQARGVLSCYAFGETHHLRVNSDFSEDEFVKHVTGMGCANITLNPIEPTIEDAFIALT